MSGWKRYDPVLWVIVAAFVVFELVAHFEFHNANGMETLSHEILMFEERYGWWARGLIAVAVVALGVHLEGVF